MAMVNAGEINLEYYVEGTGPPLLMIMGLGGQANSWGEPFLERLRPHFQVVRFSNRGTGLSDKPPGELTVRQMADDAAGLLSALGIARAHVMGISMGGMIAQELAINHPRAVQGLVLGCTFCGAAHGRHVPPETLARMGQIGALPPEQIVRQFWLLAVTAEFVEGNQAFLDEIMRIHLETPTPWATFGRQFMAVQSFDTYDRLPQIEAPTLIIHGDRDILMPVENAEILRGRIAGSRVRIVPGVGHCFFWEKPEESAAAVVEFLASVPAAA
jgi:pimeloyl-ACP methyl ester carboxylesterase